MGHASIQNRPKVDQKSIQKKGSGTDFAAKIVFGAALWLKLGVVFGGQVGAKAWRARAAGAPRRHGLLWGWGRCRHAHVVCGQCPSRAASAAGVCRVFPVFRAAMHRAQLCACDGVPRSSPTAYGGDRCPLLFSLFFVCVRPSIYPS